MTVVPVGNGSNPNRLLVVKTNSIQEDFQGKLESFRSNVQSAAAETWSNIIAGLGKLSIVILMLIITIDVVYVQTSKSPDDRLPSKWVGYSVLAVYALTSILEGLLKIVAAWNDEAIYTQVIQLWATLRVLDKDVKGLQPEPFNSRHLFVILFGLICGGLGIYTMFFNVFWAGFILWTMCGFCIRWGLVGIADSRRGVLIQICNLLRTQIDLLAAKPTVTSDKIVSIRRELNDILQFVPNMFDAYRSRFAFSTSVVSTSASTEP